MPRSVNWDIPFEDYSIKSVKPHLDPHFRSILQAAQDVVYPFQDKIRIAGGFAANLAGITTYHNDVDIFCSLEHVWKYLHPINQKREIAEEYEDIESVSPIRVKFTYRNIKFDLVDFSSKLAKESDSRYLLKCFDLNWSMSSIELPMSGNIEHASIMTHPAAFSRFPILNTAMTISAALTLKRLETYQSRLVATPDLEECKQLAEYLGKMVERQHEMELEALGYR